VGEPLRIGIIGCGNIARQYTATFARLPDVELVAVADIDAARAGELAAELDGTEAVPVDRLLADASLDAVVNLTVPAVHAEVSLRIIEAGRSVYVEKPLCATTAQAREVLAAADAAGVLVGCAPDTVLGTGLQTARRAIDDGLVGRPIAASATMVTPGHERWHPNPDFYYVPGGGPLLDMGPYYVSALVTLLGPVARVLGAASATRATRTIGSGPRAGETIPVTTPSHVTGVLVHTSGVLSTLVTSFDSVATHASPIEVHGELGSLEVPDPNRFAGAVSVRRLGGNAWEPLPVLGGYEHAARGYGLAEMRWNGDGPGLAESRASGRLGFHVLEVMEALLAAAATGRAHDVTSSVERPAPVPLSAR
jgi:predicted dehydrogenase